MPLLNERLITVGVGLKKIPKNLIKEDLLELNNLVEAAGGDVVGSLNCGVENWHPATLIGKGKILEIKEMILEVEAHLVVFDHQLSGVQSRNLEKQLQAPVLDRSQLILDIFAQRAQTFEGQLQVELAQMLDQMPRMVGAWKGSLSRLGGGIGTRGPGEKAIEIDRRRAREKIQRIQKQLEDVRNKRKLQRQSRKKNNTPSFALIGYTNSGKSSLLNRLTNSQVLCKDEVFATLDPTTRKLFLDNTTQGVITDTVGFIRKLPTKLIEAFKATLEESEGADVLLHVIDLSNSQMPSQIQTVNELIEEFNWQDKPLIHVFNKIDLIDLKTPRGFEQQPRVFVSSHTGEGISKLKKMMVKEIEKFKISVELYFPHSHQHLIYELGREAVIHKKESGTTGAVCHTSLTKDQLSYWKNYIQGRVVDT